MKLSFLDKYPKFDADGYLLTNEEPALFNKALEGQRFERAAGICSGGEVPLFVLLIHADSVIAIDHSYKALTATYIKSLVLAEYGPAVRQLLNAGYSAFLDAARKAVKEVPKELQSFFKLDPNAVGSSASYANTIDPGTFLGIVREWGYFSDDILLEASKRINCLTLVHGDLRDLRPWGPFDLVYLSNALEHSDRDRKQPDLENIKPLIKMGGSVLTTSHASSMCAAWGTQVARERSIRAAWTHYVIKRTK